MIESPIQNLPAIEAVQQIVETVQQAQSGEAPFALILGSGFSFGLVPTASELVTESLPLWTKALREQQTFEQQLELPAEERPKIAAAFWEAFLKNNAARGLELALDSKGLPENYAAAYQAEILGSGWDALSSAKFSESPYATRPATAKCRAFSPRFSAWRPTRQKTQKSAFQSERCFFSSYSDHEFRSVPSDRPSISQPALFYERYP
jgi:hypothetical protein